MKGDREVGVPRTGRSPELIAREHPQDRQQFPFKLCWQDPHTFLRGAKPTVSMLPLLAHDLGRLAVRILELQNRPLIPRREEH